MRIHMWHGHKAEETDRIDFGFDEHDCKYHGNMSAKGEIIGYFIADNRKEIWNTFPQCR